MTEPNLRRAVRGLLIDPADRILLVRMQFEDRPEFWGLPGGGIEPGEDTIAALRRELAEETGVPEAFIGPCVWERTHTTPMPLPGLHGQHNTVHLVPCHAFEPVPQMTEQELRDEGLYELRWWTLAELAATEELLRPLTLVDLVTQVLEFGAPPEPIIVTEQD